MTNEERKIKLVEAFKCQTIFKVYNVSNVNHKPHPYMIGSKHIEYASNNHSGILCEKTMQEVCCAHPKCNIIYEDHTSDLVCFLQLTRNTTNKEAAEVIKSAMLTVEEGFIDGIVFIDTEEKFKIE